MTSSTHVKEDWIRTGFIRQRRNLIVVSLTLLFVEVSGLSVRTLNVFGNQLAIQNPDIVTWALWVAYVYWLWRYYGYFHDLGDKGLGAAVDARLSDLVDRWSKRKFESDGAWRAELGKKADDQLAKDRSDDADLQSTVSATHDWQLLNVNPTSMRKMREIPVQMLLGLFVAHSSIRTQVAATNSKFNIGGFDAVALNARAWLYMLTHTRIFSEYCLPYLIASTPLLYTICHMLVR